jgi:hypothetical protein
MQFCRFWFFFYFWSHFDGVSFKWFFMKKATKVSPIFFHYFYFFQDKRESKRQNLPYKFFIFIWFRQDFILFDLSFWCQQIFPISYRFQDKQCQRHQQTCILQILKLLKEWVSKFSLILCPHLILVMCPVQHAVLVKHFTLKYVTFSIYFIYSSSSAFTFWIICNPLHACYNKTHSKCTALHKLVYTFKIFHLNTWS